MQVQRGIPYAVVGGTPFFQRSHVKNILAYLRLLVNLDDQEALTRIYNLPRRKLGAAAWAAVAESAHLQSKTLCEALFGGCEQVSFGVMHPDLPGLLPAGGQHRTG